MVRIFLAGVVLLAGGAFSSAAPSPAPPTNSPEFQQALSLIRQLGDDSFRVREHASRQLIQMGRAAKPALLRGIADANAEIAERSRRLLPVAREADLKARIEAFTQDKDGKATHDLPGWARYQKLVGADAASRALFVEILDTNSALVEVAEEEPRLLAERYTQRLQEIQMAMQRPSSGVNALRLADVAALLFVGTYGEEAKTPNRNNVNVFVGNFFYQKVFRDALTGGTQNEPVRRLFLAWMDVRTDLTSLQQGLQVAIQCDLKAALPIARKMASAKETVPFMKGMALLAIGKLGGKEQIADLEPFLADETVLGNANFNNVMSSTQMRDVALAVGIHLSGQQPKDHGFEMLQQQPLNFSYFYNLGFADDAKRTAAHAKWKEWVAKQPKK